MPIMFKLWQKLWSSTFFLLQLIEIQQSLVYELGLIIT